MDISLYGIYHFKSLRPLIKAFFSFPFELLEAEGIENEEKEGIYLVRNHVLEYNCLVFPCGVFVCQIQ